MTLQFKIQLHGISKPPVWRRILIPAELTFHEFHYVIQAAFGWFNEHLYKFQQRPYDRGWAIQIPDEENEGGGFGMFGFGPQEIDAQTVKVGDFVMVRNLQKFVYIYDFGDDWFHDITLEEVNEKQVLMHPRCLAGKGACPPEDCGGIWGYQMMKDYGEINDPKDFDIDEADESVRHFRSMMERGEILWGRKGDGGKDVDDNDVNDLFEHMRQLLSENEDSETADSAYSYQHPEYPKTLEMDNPWVGEELCKPENALGLPEPLVRRILSLPKESLRQDLERLIMYHIGLTCDEISEDYDSGDEFNGVIGSALTLLAEVGNSESSLDVVLEVMRQSDAFCDYHICDSGSELFVPTICRIGQNGLGKLLSYAKEDGLYCFLQCYVFEAVRVMAFYSPVLRPRIIEWFRNVLQFYAKHVEEHDVDTEMLSLMMCDIVDLHAPELLPDIKALYETGAIHEGTAGSYKSVERDVKKSKFPNPLENYTFSTIDRFKDMQSFYEESYE